jgi:arginine exporter protein ArgO
MNTEDIVYLSVGLVVACILGIFLYLTYTTSYEAFISYVGLLFVVYATISLSYTLIKKNMYKEYEFKVNLITDIFALILAFIIMSYFGIKAYFYVKPSTYRPEY